MKNKIKHEFVGCDICKQFPIVGVRYKCTVCISFSFLYLFSYHHDGLCRYVRILIFVISAMKIMMNHMLCLLCYNQFILPQKVDHFPYPPFFHSFYLSIFLSCFLSIFLSIYLPFYLSSFLSIFLSIFLSNFLSFFLFFYLLFFISFFSSFIVSFNYLFISLYRFIDLKLTQ
jgi:hypothetical protein